MEVSFTVLFDGFTYYCVVEIDISNRALKKNLIKLYGENICFCYPNDHTISQLIFSRTIETFHLLKASGLMMLLGYALIPSERSENNMISKLMVVSSKHKILYQVTTPSKYSDLHYGRSPLTWCSSTARIQTLYKESATQLSKLCFHSSITLRKSHHCMSLLLKQFMTSQGQRSW